MDLDNRRSQYTWFDPIQAPEIGIDGTQSKKSHGLVSVSPFFISLQSPHGLRKDTIGKSDIRRFGRPRMPFA